MTLLCIRQGHEHSRVTFVELFFDLVFVFAITQLSHLLLEHFTLLGGLQTALLLMAVWTMWIYTSWATNWLDPDRTPVRLMLFAVMLAGLIMSSSIPGAFGERGLGFAGALVVIQFGRSLFILYAMRERARFFRNFQRIQVWIGTASIFWIAGGFASGDARLLLCSWR